MRRSSGKVVVALCLAGLPASLGFLLWRLEALEGFTYYLVFSAILAAPVELMGTSLYLRLTRGRDSVLPGWRSAAEFAGILAIAVSLAFVVPALVWPATVARWLLFSWKSAFLFFVCVAGVTGASFGKGSVRVTALLGGLATLVLMLALGTSP